ncbi:MAG: hypothetical protein ACLGIG_00465 [Actinomycetes bacterium]
MSAEHLSPHVVETGSTLPRRLGRRTEADLTRMQVEAVDAWHRARRVAEEAAATREASREVRMDLSRRLEVLRAQHEAIVARADRHLSQSVHLLTRRTPLRAVVVHRNAWFVSKLATGLEAAGIEVLEALENGAEGVGVVVAEQPDLLLVEDVLPMLPGEEVVRETRRFSPDTVVAAQVAYADRIAAMVEAGAATAFTRQIPPQDVAREVVGLLTERVHAS